MESRGPVTKSTRLRIEVKVSPEQKDLFERASAQTKQGVSEFVRSAAEKAARELLKR
jgi:uncharacterized protein (DUF1778 family)